MLWFLSNSQQPLLVESHYLMHSGHAGLFELLKPILFPPATGPLYMFHSLCLE